VVEMTLIKAESLREKENINNIPRESGYYKWYAPESVLKVILDRYYKQIVPLLQTKVINGDTYYYVYAGISKSLRLRLNTHVNKTSRVSTLRRTLSSIAAKDQTDIKKTNALIDKMFVEYTAVEYEKAADTEQKEIAKFALPLNVEFQENKDLAEYTQWLIKQRRQAMQIRS
jgi:hypothetical protein